MSELSPGPGRTGSALLSNSLPPSLRLSLFMLLSTIPPGSTLPSDSSPAGSAELQLAEKLPRTKNGAMTWHSTAEEPPPSSLIENPTLSQQLPLPPYFDPPPPPHSSTPPGCYRDTQRGMESHWAWQRNRVGELSIRMRAVLDSCEHTNKPVCCRVWHTLTWPHGPGFMCSLTNCSSKSFPSPLECVAQNINKDQEWRAIRIPPRVFLLRPITTEGS